MKKNVAPFVLGLIGGILGVIGGLCWAVCAELADAITQETNYAIYAWVFGVGGGVVGIVGASLGLNNGKKGGILMLLSAALIVGAMVTLDFTILLIACTILLSLGGILGLSVKK